MTLQSEVYGGELPGLADALLASLPAFGGDEGRAFVAGSDPILTGPFASYSADPRKFVEDGNAERCGWRGLITQGNEPIAIVDVFETDSGPSYGFRGEDAAIALARALQLASRFEQDERHFSVRWLSLPDIYVTTLWLTGPANLYVPTRLGNSERPEPAVVDHEAFQAQVRSIVAAMTSANRNFAPEGDSPRSGLR